MALGLFRDLVKGRTDIEADSAGIGAVSGLPASPHAITVMEEIGIDISDIRSKPITAELVRRADYIFCMSYSQLDSLLLLFPSAAEKTYLLREFEEDVPLIAREIPDPIGGSLEVYRFCRDQIAKALPKVVDFVLSSETGAKQPAPAGAKRVALASDHTGIALKEVVRDWLKQEGYVAHDLGPFCPEPVDYPDYAGKVGRNIRDGEAQWGIMIGENPFAIAVAANKILGVRAVAVEDPQQAEMCRREFNANLLCLPSQLRPSSNLDSILRRWFATPFSQGPYKRQVQKIEALAKLSHKVVGSSEWPPSLAEVDQEIAACIEREARRQSENLELIASENFASRAVQEAQGSCLTNKYAEGYPGRRWYGGCQNVDEIEVLAIERAKKLFGAEYVNVQPHSGSQANMAVYFAVLQPGDTILAMDLSHGGHLTHGHRMNFSGRFFQVVSYGVRREDERLDYEEIEKLAFTHRPKLIMAGASAYPRILDFARLSQIAQAVGAYLFVDMAHIAGLVAAGLHPSPLPYADFVTTTTHKTLRGPRGGVIFAKAKYGKILDAQVFPGIQGGPLPHVIAAKAVAFYEALQPSFKAYQEQVVRNAKALAEGLRKHGYRLVSGGTDTHLLLVDLRAQGITGRQAQDLLDRAGITVNKNAIPFDTLPPAQAGGIRLGTPAVTTRGMKEEEMFQIADWIHEVFQSQDQPQKLEAIRKEVWDLTARFPLPF